MSIERKKAIKQIMGIVVLFMALGAVKMWQDTQEKPNPKTNCYKHISGKMAILIKTDIIPIQTQTEIQNRAWDAIQEHSKMGDLISVYEITQNSLQNLQPSFQMCRPKSGDDASELTENVKNINKKFKDQFEKPLLNILSNNTGQAQAPLPKP